MKSIQFGLLVLLGLCVMSCKSTPQAKGESVTINYDQVQSGHWVIENLEYVSLETTDASLLGGIDKVRFVNNKFYILDKLTKGVYVFDRQGKFLSSIVKAGEGPDEYVELMDMDIDEEGHVYLADNARMNILKYKAEAWTHMDTYHIGEHFFEFSCLGSGSFLLKDVFGADGQKMKLAYWNGKDGKITPLIEKKYSSINELDIMRCSKYNLYHSSGLIYYNDRFSPDVYAISHDGKMEKRYTIASENYISEQDLKSLEKQPLQFLREREHIKDVICLYENDEFFICKPFVSPSAAYLLVPKDDASKAKKINFSDKQEFMGGGLIEGVADNKFFMVLNHLIEGAVIPEDVRKNLNEDSNPLLLLFAIGAE